jgi:uncharacterized protein involved in exopolysaccharide biosynthesis
MTEPFTRPAVQDAMIERTVSDIRLWALLPVAGSLLGLILGFVIPPRYTSSASFFPETREVGRDLGAFAGLAQQFGFGLAGGGQSPQFYVQVLGSRTLLDRLLQQPVVRRDGTSQPLLTFLVHRGSDSARRHDKALGRLREAIHATVNPRTNIVDVQVTLKDPVAARAVAAMLLGELDRFNFEVRRSQSGQRRRFLEARLAEAYDSLFASEARLRSFLERNRSYRGSPGLEVELERYQRQVGTHQTLITGLRRDFESARLDEVNDTPVFSIIDAPSTPSRRSSPSRSGAVLTGLVGGLTLMALAVSGRYWFRRLELEEPGRHAAVVRFLQGFRARRNR